MTSVALFVFFFVMFDLAITTDDDLSRGIKTKLCTFVYLLVSWTATST